MDGQHVKVGRELFVLHSLCSLKAESFNHFNFVSLKPVEDISDDCCSVLQLTGLGPILVK